MPSFDNLLLFCFHKALIKFKSHLYFEEKDLVDKAEKVFISISCYIAHFYIKSCSLCSLVSFLLLRNSSPYGICIYFAEP